MERLCPNCFRPLAGDARACRRCRTVGPPLLGVLALPVVVSGVITLNVHLCIAGAVVGLVAIAWYGVRLLR